MCSHSSASSPPSLPTLTLHLTPPPPPPPTSHTLILTAENLPLDKIAQDNRIGTLRLGKGSSSSDREKCSC